MESLVCSLLGVLLAVLVIWNFLLQASLKELKGLIQSGYNSNERYYEANKERIDCLNNKYNAICYGWDLIMDHLGLEIVHTPAKDEVIKSEKQCHKKEKAK